MKIRAISSLRIIVSPVNSVPAVSPFVRGTQLFHLIHLTKNVCA